MKLKCNCCGRVETEPFDFGDKCYEGCGFFVEVLGYEKVEEMIIEEVAKIAAAWIMKGIEEHPEGIDGFIADMDKTNQEAE